MTDYPCNECGSEGRGIAAHKSSCSRDPYKRPLTKCPICQQHFLRKHDPEFCEDCSDRREWLTDKAEPRRFRLIRRQDHSGVSGTGHVADGCQFWTGQCAIVWRTETSSVNLYRSIEELEKVHGHGGSTLIEWIDP